MENLTLFGSEEVYIKSIQSSKIEVKKEEFYSEEKKNERTTAPTQKAGFRVPKAVLWLLKV